jgi:hypothetical protein
MRSCPAPLAATVGRLAEIRPEISGDIDRGLESGGLQVTVGRSEGVDPPTLAAAHLESR